MTSQQTASTDTVHAEILAAIVRGAPGSTTEQVHAMYEALAPITYRGSTKSPVRRRWRRVVLKSLDDAGDLEYYDTPTGWVWIPTEELAVGGEIGPDADLETDLGGDDGVPHRITTSDPITTNE